jgi:hypothetical protein
MLKKAAKALNAGLSFHGLYRLISKNESKIE